jgi:signal transduction histidine kinase
MSHPADRPGSNAEAGLLAERVKELNCLYGISRLFERSGQGLDQILQAVVELLPPAWQHPEVAQALIELHNDRYGTKGFRDTPWEQACPIIVEGETAGWVRVSYTEERPASDEGPFLAEERSLLNAVSQRLGGLIEREQSRQQLIAYQENLRSLAAELAASEQQERRRIAELLHDRIGQALALLCIKLGQARVSTDDQALRELLAETQAMAGEVIAETRSLTFELCPPILYELGLGQAVEWLGECFCEKYGLKVRVREGGDPGRLSDQLRTTLFQAVRELLTNVVKHAHADTAEVSLAGRDGWVIIRVQDDGVGAEPHQLECCLAPRDGFGLFNIKERLTYLGGRMQADTAPGRGTTVTLEVPCDQPPAVVSGKRQ